MSAIHLERLTLHERRHRRLVIPLGQLARLPLNSRSLFALVRAYPEKGIHGLKTRPTALALADAKRQPKLEEALSALMPQLINDSDQMESHMRGYFVHHPGSGTPRPRCSTREQMPNAALPAAG
jgi:hypothetical protein